MLLKGRATFSRASVPKTPKRASKLHAGELIGARAQPDEKWQRLGLIRRQLQLAVVEEDFSQAAVLRDHLKDLKESMPPTQQFLAHKLQLLDFGTLVEQEEALQAIGQVGGMDILGEVAEYLKKPHLDRAASMALYKIWHRPPNDDPTISELMTQGCNMLVVTQKQMPAMPQGGILLEQAEKIFSHIIHLDPAFAEGWNKRATCRFHLGEFKGSIHDCEITLGLNAYHFGAMVGQGYCHMKLHEYRPAVTSFEKALQIHPGLEGVRKYIEILKAGADQQEDGPESSP